MLKELKHNHREIARLQFEGFKPTEIADQLTMSVSRVRVIQTDPLYKAHLDKLVDLADNSTISIRRRLAELSTKAVNVLDDLLSHDDVAHSTQLKAAQDVLNRNGHAPKVEHQHVHAHITSEDLIEMKRRALAHGATIIEGS